MNTLEIKKDAAIEAYKNTSKEGRKLLEDLFGNYQFTSITERIKTFEDVLEELNLSPIDFKVSPIDFKVSPIDFKVRCEYLEIDEVAYRKLRLIVQCLNEGWKPDFTDKNQEKYYPWFEVNDAGSAYALSSNAPSRANATVGSHLCFKSRELALYAGKTFDKIYTDYLL